jgi:hypothetical protein
VRQNLPRIRPGLRKAFRTVVSAPGKTWGLFLFNAGVILLLYLLYNLLSRGIDMRGTFTILLSFLMLQAFVYVRILASVTNWSSTVHMDAYLNEVDAWPAFAGESQQDQA